MLGDSTASTASLPAYADSLDLHPGQSAHLPAGWIREFDKKTARMFYVDTLAQPPRSTWRPHFSEEPKDVPSPVFQERVKEQIGLMGISASFKNKLLGGTSAERQLHKARRDELDETLKFSKFCQRDPDYKPRFDPPPPAEGLNEEQRMAAGYRSVGGAGVGYSGEAAGAMGGLVFGGMR